jgi:hypothetical protein
MRTTNTNGSHGAAPTVGNALMQGLHGSFGRRF